MKHLDLFAGIGGFALAAQALGFTTRQLVEINPFCQQVLAKNFSGVPLYGDICTFTAKSGDFDLITAGYPCQDNSRANPNGKGLDGERSGLWREARRIIGECNPDFAIVENVPPTQSRRWDVAVRADLENLGYHTTKIKLSARDLGAWHLRERVFIAAYSVRLGLDPIKAKAIERQQSSQKTKSSWWEGSFKPCRGVSGRIYCLPHSGALRVDDGISSELDRDRIHALGNAVSPQMAIVPMRFLEELAK